MFKRVEFSLQLHPLLLVSLALSLMSVGALGKQCAQETKKGEFTSLVAIKAGPKACAGVLISIGNNNPVVLTSEKCTKRFTKRDNIEIFTGLAGLSVAAVPRGVGAKVCQSRNNVFAILKPSRQIKISNTTNLASLSRFDPSSRARLTVAGVGRASGKEQRKTLVEKFQFDVSQSCPGQNKLCLKPALQNKCDGRKNLCQADIGAPIYKSGTNTVHGLFDDLRGGFQGKQCGMASTIHNALSFARFRGQLDAIMSACKS